MKHAKHTRRLPAHVQAAVDRLRARGAEILDVMLGRVVRIVFALAGRRDLLKVPANPRRAAACARNRCAKVEAMCWRHARVLA